MKSIHSLILACLAALAALPLAAAPDPPQAEAAPPGEGTAPEKIWPAGLTRIAGTYRFIQVASPGGLWQRTAVGDQVETQQVSISQLPKALRDQLENAEIQILDLQNPTIIEASQQKSPGVGGMLRHYTEEARGKLVMRGLPGIGSIANDSGEYRGDVLFAVEHSSLSNPSVSGVWKTRRAMEMTWGAATLDFADLTAMKPVKQGEDAEPEYPIFNARILRSGLEIFAFIEWTDPEESAKGNQRRIWGSVRLLRVLAGEIAPPPAADAR